MLEELPISTHATRPPEALDYSLTGENATRAIERGLAEAQWYQTPVDRSLMRKLLERRNGPAIRDTLLWFALMIALAIATIALWHTWWWVVPWLAYCVLYASSSDSRWHEAGHGTAFRTDWMNNALYQIASFMVMREPDVWRWSHTRHHSDTIIVGRDPEIAVPRPPDVRSIWLNMFRLFAAPKYFRQLLEHAAGRISDAEKTFIPTSAFPRIHRVARIHLAIYAAAILLALMTWSILPLLFVGLPNFFGSWLMVVYGLTQHAGMAENVLDHRLNSRTVYMNFVHRYLYWNMNYHVEHHMFPLVPYHALPRLHALVRHDMPTPYRGLIETYREIIPALRRQIKDPAWHVKRRLPDPPARPAHGSATRTAHADDQGWLDVCGAHELERQDIVRLDHGQRTFAICRDDQGRLFATDGICTHGNTHLSEGLVQGNIIECPKHNGRFHLADGSPARAPVCRGLATYPVCEREGRIVMDPTRPGGAGARPTHTLHLRVVQARNVATFIREIELAPVDDASSVDFVPGDYLQVDIPAYEQIAFADFDIPEPYATVWKRQHVFDLIARNPSGEPRRNNYSLAGNPATDRLLRLNVRIATPPPGQDCPPGIGSSWMFSLQPGDTLSAVGPHGDFHIKPTQREMVYIGGGAGMGPLRSHLAHLFETSRTARKVSYWYGARSRQELYYVDYFEQLAANHPNFSFHPALSAPLPEDNWQGLAGLIHEVTLEHHLSTHRDPTDVEYYLCGPPMMIQACTAMLAQLGVAEHQIAFDAF